MAKVTNNQLQQNIESLTLLLKESVQDIKKTNEEALAKLSGRMDELSLKIDGIDSTLRTHAEQIDRAEVKITEIEAKLDDSNDIHKNELQTLSDRVRTVEE